jgi:hypothetical protein
MNVHSEITKLKNLAKSYFRRDFKRFCHFGDCRIYSSQRPLCDCGLIYRLNHLDCTLASIVYPDFEDQLYTQETGKRKKRKISKKEMAESMKILEEVFGKIEKSSFEELKMDYDEMYKILDTIFSPRAFPAAFKRLEKWLTNEVKK